jgi:hypothetical protein
MKFTPEILSRLNTIFSLLGENGQLSEDQEKILEALLNEKVFPKFLLDKKKDIANLVIHNIDFLKFSEVRKIFTETIFVEENSDSDNLLTYWGAIKSSLGALELSQIKEQYPDIAFLDLLDEAYLAYIPTIEREPLQSEASLLPPSAMQTDAVSTTQRMEPGIDLEQLLEINSSKQLRGVNLAKILLNKIYLLGVSGDEKNRQLSRLFAKIVEDMVTQRNCIFYDFIGTSINFLNCLGDCVSKEDNGQEYPDFLTVIPNQSPRLINIFPVAVLQFISSQLKIIQKLYTEGMFHEAITRPEPAYLAEDTEHPVLTSREKAVSCLRQLSQGKTRITLLGGNMPHLISKQKQLCLTFLEKIITEIERLGGGILTSVSQDPHPHQQKKISDIRIAVMKYFPTACAALLSQGTSSIFGFRIHWTPTNDLTTAQAVEIFIQQRDIALFDIYLEKGPFGGTYIENLNASDILKLLLDWESSILLSDKILNDLSLARKLFENSVENLMKLIDAQSRFFVNRLLGIANIERFDTQKAKTLREQLLTFDVQQQQRKKLRDRSISLSDKSIFSSILSSPRTEARSPGADLSQDPPSPSLDVSQASDDELSGENIYFLLMDDSKLFLILSIEQIRLLFDENPLQNLLQLPVDILTNLKKIAIDNRFDDLDGKKDGIESHFKKLDPVSSASSSNQTTSNPLKIEYRTGEDVYRSLYNNTLTVEELFNDKQKVIMLLQEKDISVLVRLYDDNLLFDPSEGDFLSNLLSFAKENKIDAKKIAELTQAMQEILDQSRIDDESLNASRMSLTPTKLSQPGHYPNPAGILSTPRTPVPPIHRQLDSVNSSVSFSLTPT